MGERARSQPLRESYVDQFRADSTVLLDRIMPAPSIICCLVVLWVARSKLETAALSLGFIASHLVLNIAIRRAQRRRAPSIEWLIGGVRLGVILVFVPAITYVAGPPFGWLLAVPTACVMPFYFRGWYAWLASGVQIVATTLAFVLSDANLGEAVVALGVSVTLVFIAHPITRALESQVVQARAAERAKSAFLANTSHEIRTPLNGVMGTLSLLGESELTPAQRQLVDISSRSAESLCAILNDILDLSKLEQGKLTVVKRTFDLTAALGQIEHEHRLLAQRDGTVFSLEIEPEVPRYVAGDQLRIQQILRNFLSNAFKFARGSKVEVSVRNLGEQLEFAVEDAGIGLVPEELSRIFERFEQADGATSRRYGGTGLGLNIARHLAQLMGGSVGASSELGRGSRFWLRVALEARAGLDPDPSRRFRLPSMRRPALRVLLVEDNETNRLVATRMLEGEGCQVSVATDGSQVLEKFDLSVFDLVLMDCHMPNMDGYETTRRIRRREENTGRRLPIVALTASVMASETALCREVGMDAYIAKPVRRPELVAVLESVESGVIARVEH